MTAGGTPWLMIVTIACAMTASASAAPQLFWISGPVGPDETVMVHGSDLGGAAAVVELARLDDSDPTAPAAPPRIKAWTRVPVLQGSGDTLKFVVPAAWQMGVFACRITADNSAAPVAFLNAPDPWWIQGDEGESATPGGWLRILGKSLGGSGHPSVLLQPEQGQPIALPAPVGDDYSLRLALPANLVIGAYTVKVHNGAGGAAAWRDAGTLRVVDAPQAGSIFSVLETYGPDAAKEMRKSLIKYNQPIDRTDGILAALKKAKEKGGGVVYFPAGRYTVKGPLEIPDHTTLKGEGEGVVTLWWGAGHFNLDGGGPQGRARIDEPKPPHTLISGADFGVENMSLFFPVDYEQGVVSEKRLRLSHVRIRIDHYWLVQGRGNGTVARLGRNFQVTDCDILAKGDGLVPGEFGVIAHNRILSNKSNTPMGGSKCIIVEDNRFVSMDPTAYQNISGSGRNIYYGHNRQEALYAQQSDYSFTFDAATGAYLGPITAAGTRITLGADPAYPKWAPEKHGVWKQSALFIIDGHGAGQWRDVTANHGREWRIDRPFDVAPDSTSVATVASFNGRTLIVDNQFEDGNWVNAGYGMSIDVICAGNHLARCADLMNYGLHGETFAQPSWHVQYFDNVVAEGQTQVGSSGGGHKSQIYSGPVTRWAIHRRQTLTADNGGGITLSGNVRDAIIEGCTVKHPASVIKVDGAAEGVVLRNNTFDGPDGPRYEGDGIKKAAGLQ
jgi:hypothetical protein